MTPSSANLNTHTTIIFGEIDGGGKKKKDKKNIKKNKKNKNTLNQFR